MANLRSIYNVLGQNGATLIKDTVATTTGPYLGFLVIGDAVLNATGTVIAEWDGGAVTDVPFPAGMFIPGLFSAIQLVSGIVIAYKAI